MLDKESDVCEGTSKANSGIVHAGHDAKPGTLKAKLNVQGNLMMEEMAEKLDFHLKEMVRLLSARMRKSFRNWRN